MSREVTVHVNRGSADSLEPSVERVETRGSFDLRLESHGAPAHVHCRLDGDLSRIASLETSNYYVDGEGETYVPVHVTADAIDDPIEGTLEVLTGYGSESVALPVTVEPAPSGIDVDESLAEPGGGTASATEAGTGLDRLFAGDLEPATLAIVALGLLAVGIGALTAAAIGGPVATIGTLIVVGGVAVALLLLAR